MLFKKIIIKIIYLYRRLYKLLFYFFTPNLRTIIRHRIKFTHKISSFNQITLFRGNGIVEIGKNCSFGYKLGGFYRGGSIELQPRYKNSFIKIGNKVATNNNIFICAANYIEIGDNVLIGQGVCFMDSEAHGIQPDKRREIGEIGQIIIGNNVWIGNNVTILKNSEIGANCIVAAHAVVSGKFPNNVIIGGVPAKIIKRIDD